MMHYRKRGAFYMSSRTGGAALLVSRASGGGFGRLSGDLVFALFRRHRRPHLLLFHSAFGVDFARPWFAAVSIYFFSFSCGVGSYRGCGGFASPFLVFRSALGLLVSGGFAFAFSYSSAPPIGRSLKLTTISRWSGRSR